MVQIKFKTFGATSAGGAFAPGDVMRCSEEMARHLVDEAKCAAYIQTAASQDSEAVEEAKPTRRRKTKE